MRPHCLVLMPPAFQPSWKYIVSRNLSFDTMLTGFGKQDLGLAQVISFSLDARPTKFGKQGNLSEAWKFSRNTCHCLLSAINITLKVRCIWTIVMEHAYLIQWGITLLFNFTYLLHCHPKPVIDPAKTIPMAFKKERSFTL